MTRPGLPRFGLRLLLWLGLRWRSRLGFRRLFRSGRRLLPGCALGPVLACGLPLAGGLLTPGLARAAYTAPELVSYTGTTEAEDAYSPALSADGEYVAFTGSFDGVRGVYRKDLATGELELVAGENAAEPALDAPNAGSPSISEDGRYVSFTTTGRLDPADDQSGDPGDCSSVYVRDMAVPAAQPGAYKLVSALNGTTQGIAYAGDSSADCPGGGSASADRVAISGDGEMVAFTVLGSSDLSTGAGGATTTPPDQIAVRDWRTDTTTLVSQTLRSLGGTPEAVPGGAALAPLRDSLQFGGRQISGSTAAISAEGNVVAWMGTDIAAQAPATAAEDSSESYDEPLWRQIGDGPGVPIRRVTGGDDPACGCAGPFDTAFDPNAAAGDGTAERPEYGTYVARGGFGGDPLGGGESLDDVTPQLSANGQTVAILSTQPRTGEVSRGLEEELTTSTANAYVVNMAGGITRGAALTQLTEWASDDFRDNASTGAVQNIALSPSGEQVAFTTSRIEFPLSPPTLITPALGQADASQQQLYVANLGAGTLALVSYGYDGEPANGNVATPSFTRNGQTLAFASAATNLVYGAYDRGNESGEPGNVFLVSELTTPLVPGVQTIGAVPANPSAPKPWELIASAGPGPHGTVVVYVTAPGAGTLKARAKAAVPVTVTVTRREGKASRVRRRKRTVIAARTVASAKAIAGGTGPIELRLTSASAYRSLVASHDGVYATITLTFTAPGEPTLTSSVQATFHGKPSAPAEKARPARAKGDANADKRSKAKAKQAASEDRGSEQGGWRS